MEKGILTSTVESKLGQKLDDLVKLNPLLETFDGTAFTLVIRTIDNNFGEKIPEPYKTELRDVLASIIEEEDYDTAVEEGFNFLDSLIDIPGFDDDEERLIFQGSAYMVIALITYLKKKI